MSFLLRSAAKDLRRRLRDPISLLFWIGIPVAIAGLLALVAGGGDGGTPTAHVLVVDRDSTFLSGLVTGAGGSGGPAAEFLRLEAVGEEEGRERIDAGEASALLVLPDGFAAAVLEGAPAELTLVTNPAQRILPGIVRQGLEMLVEAVFYLRQILGEDLDLMAAGPPAGLDFFADESVAGIATRINARVRGLGDVLFPPVLELQMETPEEDEGEGFNFGLLFLPGLLFMAVLFIAQGVSDEVWSEKEGGTLRRALLTPHGAAPFLGGKLLAGAALCGGIALVAVGAAAAFFAVPASRLPLAVVWCTYAGTALLAYFLLIQLFATSQRGGYLITTILVFPLIMVGGSFFPFEAMPAWMAAVGRWTPNGLAVVRLKEVMLGTVDWGALGASALGIGVPAAAAFLVAVRRLRGGFATG